LKYVDLNVGANVVMKTYHITFKAKDREECMSFVARSQEFAENALRAVYAGTTIKVLYVVCNDIPTEVL
jgi:hypothetical protein